MPNEMRDGLVECCVKPTSDCENFPYYKKEECFDMAKRDALDLINRQQAEIERLTINMNAFGLGMKREKERADTIRAEAIKEFAERLQYEIDHCDERGEIFINARSINEMFKEMVGE